MTFDSEFGLKGQSFNTCARGGKLNLVLHFSGTLLFPYKAEPCKENMIVLKETLYTRKRKENFHNGERKTGENQICGH